MLRVVELYCGIGGCAVAMAGRAQVVAAVDQNRRALVVYALNFPHPVVPRIVESIPEAAWRAWQADMWWLSPPCPPFTRRGLRRDLDDSRAASFQSLLARLEAVRPRALAFENVPGFAGSRAHERLTDTLARAGYDTRETLLCPTELGLPNRRPRFYLVASLDGLRPWPARTGPPRRLADLLEPHPDAALWCDPALLKRYERAIDVVDAEDDSARTACFTSAYGRSVVRSGSYLITPSGLRRFAPREILRLLDFPETFALPPGLPLRSVWRLVGNSLSVRAVRWVLAAVMGEGAEAPHRG